MGSIFVLPEYQGQGIGSALIDHLLAYLKQEGIKEFCLDSGYEQAQKTWTRKFGKPYAIAKDHWAPGVDNMVWKCSLPIKSALSMLNAFAKTSTSKSALNCASIKIT